ncbi:MAG: oligosaccharide flippase family protein [Clostridia bacterium]|nr:oligosaccharide flippase family protein [Clostridia bacterium]
MEKKQSSFVKGAAILGIAGLIVKVIGAFFRVPLANHVGPEGMSYYEVAYPYYSGLLVIASAGLPTAISKMVSERVTMRDYRGAREVFRTAQMLLLVIGIVLGLLMFFLAKPLAASSGLDDAYLSFRAFAPALLFVSIMCAYRGYLQGMQQMSGTAISQIVEQLGKLLIGLALAIKLLPKGPQYAAMGAIIGVTASELIALIAIFLIYRMRKKGFDAKLSRSPQTKPRGFGVIAKSLLAIAIPVTIGASISSLAGIVDVALIINILTNNLGYETKVAQTAFSLLRTNVTTLTNMPGVLTMALAMSLVPAISAGIARRESGSVRLASRLGLKLALIIGIPCATGLFVLAAPVISLLYPNLTAAELALATDLMHTASIGVIFLSMVQTMTGVLQGMGKQNVPVFNLFLGFLLKVAVLLVLMNIPSVNIQGAAVSTVVCYAFAGIADTVYTARRARLKLPVFDVFLKPLLASLMMGAAVHFAYGYLAGGGHTTLATLASVCAGVGVYGILAVLLKMFSYDELALIPGGTKLRRLIYPKGNPAK